MFFRMFLDLAVAVVVGLHPAPNGATEGTVAGVPARPPVVQAPGRLGGGPRPPKKPPEKRPHDATWSDIKSRVGGRP